MIIMSSRLDFLLTLESYWRPSLALLHTEDAFWKLLTEVALKLSLCIECRLVHTDATISAMCTAILDSNASRLNDILDHYDCMGYNAKEPGRFATRSWIVEDYNDRQEAMLDEFPNKQFFDEFEQQLAVPNAKGIICPQPSETDCNETALCLAAALNRTDAIEALLERGADLEEKGNAVTVDRHEEYAKARQNSKLTINIGDGVMVNIKIGDGVMTPLEMATFYNSNEALHLLLERGAKEVTRALGIAVTCGNYKQVRMIMR